MNDFVEVHELDRLTRNLYAANACMKVNVEAAEICIAAAKPILEQLGLCQCYDPPNNRYGIRKKADPTP